MINILDNKKERDCTNCKHCKKHYLFAVDSAEFKGLSCEITNASVRIVGNNKTVSSLLFKQCPLAEKKGEL